MNTKNRLLSLLSVVLAAVFLSNCSSPTGGGTTFSVTPEQANILATYGTVKVLKKYDEPEKWVSMKEKLVVIATTINNINVNGVTVDTLKPIIVAKIGDDEDTVFLVDMAVSFFPSKQMVPALNNSWASAIASGITRGVDMSKAPVVLPVLPKP